ncbi:hypothetical protein TTHERM_000971789 (macronuclear) [Tetrahymena thermophila SB210]|uniref:Uncharacterized protein n=1 Tax=Tetrahymena thermophila (strain SB210) TaxID=312017 RepID=W7XCD7_TETTS|nr:hypothetical protein TTHERM_000971789 [Tetrahymena thermophila SB210]EWS71411.1 hypothetical protein TTHERM_000971789 [Tetrahymena thermophila SB210]|eukprot:XP_012656052.1 hypothetical protein TTHERM_000971789 [Tetrahymena thermophila SB210]
MSQEKYHDLQREQKLFKNQKDKDNQNEKVCIVFSKRQQENKQINKLANKQYSEHILLIIIIITKLNSSISQKDFVFFKLNKKLIKHFKIRTFQREAKIHINYSIKVNKSANSSL